MAEICSTKRYTSCCCTYNIFLLYGRYYETNEAGSRGTVRFVCGLIFRLEPWFRSEYSIRVKSGFRFVIGVPVGFVFFLEVEVEAEGEVACVERDTSLAGHSCVVCSVVGTLISEEADVGYY